MRPGKLLILILLGALLGSLLGTMLGTLAAALAQAEGADPTAPALAVGEIAPDFQLRPLRFYDFKIDQREITRENAAVLYEAVRLSDFRGEKAVALLFDRETKSDESSTTVAFQRLHDRHQASLQFLLVHSSTSAAGSPPTELDRMRIANTFVTEQALDVPCLVDSGASEAVRAYMLSGARAVLVDKAGRIAHIGSSDVDLGELERAIQRELSRVSAP